MLAFLGLVATAATTVVWFIEARRSRLDILTTWTFLTPVFGIVLSAVVLGERPAGWTAAGLVTVLVAMWLVVRPARERRPEPPRPTGSLGRHPLTRDDGGTLTTPSSRSPQETRT